MRLSVSWPASLRFWSQLTWNQWLGSLLLILFGCFNLIWPLPCLIALVSLILIGLFLVYPYAALGITIILIGFEGLVVSYNGPEVGTDVGSSLYYLLSIPWLICWCCARAAKLTPPYQSTTIDLPLFIFWLTGVIALLWTPYFYAGLRLVIALTLSYSLFLLISVHNNTPRDLERLLWLFFVLGIIMIVTVFASFFFSFLFVHNLSERFELSLRVSQYKGMRASLSGFMPAAKAIASVLNQTIFCSLALLCTRARRSSRWLIGISLLGMLFIHTLTLSRIESVGLFCGWLAFVQLNPQWRHRRIRQHVWMVVAVSAVLVALIAMMATFYNLTELIARSASEEQTLGASYHGRFSAAQARWDHLQVALEGIWETGGFGAGAAGIMQIINPSGQGCAPSLYVSFLVDHGYGLLSLILMFWIMINVTMELRWAYQNCPDPRFKIIVAAICGNIIVLAITGLLDNFYYIWIMWVEFALAVAAVKGVRYLIKNRQQFP